MPVFQKTWQVFLSGLDKVQARPEMRARPLRIHLEINDYCNLKCIMCSRENDAILKDSGAISLETVKRLEPYLRRASRVGIAGNGEPFMHVEMLDILDFICTQGAVPATVTNCTLLRQDVCDRLVEMGSSLIMGSIDGGSKEVFEKIRLGANFDLIRENLLRLRHTKERAGTPYPTVNFISCLMKENLYDLENLVRFAHEVGALEINLQNLFPYHDEAWPHVVTDMDLLDQRVSAARVLAEELGVAIRYSPMGIGVEERIAHAERVGDAAAPTAGLQLNGRVGEAKTVGGDLGEVLKARGEGRDLGPKLLEAPGEAKGQKFFPKPEPPKKKGDTKASTGSAENPVSELPTSDAGMARDMTAVANTLHENSGPSKSDGCGAESDIAAQIEAATHSENPAAFATDAAENQIPNGTAHGVSGKSAHPTDDAQPGSLDVPADPKFYCPNVFQQMHVTVTGEVRPCCFWTEETLGNIKERTIDEIWNDPYMQGVRAAILRGDLPRDCQTCHNLVPYDKRAIWSDTKREMASLLT